MDAVEFLRRIEKIDRIIENKIAELEHFRDLTQKVTASYGGDRVQASMSQQKMADAVCRCVDIEREIADAVETMQNDRREIMAVIEQLDARQYDLLFKIYVERLTLIDAAAACGMEYRTAIRTKNAAINNVQRIIDKNVT